MGRQKEERRRKRLQQKLLCTPNPDEQTCIIILHPQGNIRLWWDISSLFMLAYDCIVTPLQLIMEKELLALFVCGWLVNCFWTLDIGASMITGIYKDAKLTMRWRSIVRSYMSRGFFFDVLVIMPDWIAVFVEYDGNAAKSLSTVRALKIIRFLRLLRMVKLKRLVVDIAGRFTCNSTLAPMRLAAVMALIIMVMHVIACFWFLIGDSEDGWA